MIHPQVKPAIGCIETDHGDHKGQAILIGPSLVVSCAHVVARAHMKPRELEEQPRDGVRIRFPNHTNAERTGRVVAWKPYDPNLSPGSDLALLEVEPFGKAGPATVLLEDDNIILPADGQPVMLLEYGAADPYGEMRKGRWVDTSPVKLQIEGERFIEAGVSGSPVLYPFPGRGMVGIAAGCPTDSGPNAHGYAIPARHVASLVEEYVARAAEALAGDMAEENTAPVAGLTAIVAQLRKGVEVLRRENVTQQIADFVEGGLDRVDLAAASKAMRSLISAAGMLVETLEDARRDCESVVLRGRGPGGSDLAAVEAFAPFRLAAIRDALAPLLNAERAPPRGLIPNDLTDETSAYQQSSALRRQIAEEIRCLEPEPGSEAAVEELRNLDLRLRPKWLDPVKLQRSQQEIDALPPRFLDRDGLRGIIEALQMLIGDYVALAADLSVFRDRLSDGAGAPEMVVVPTGEFLMGSPEEVERYETEGPQHRVTISSRFAIGRNPVTFEEYDYFCGATKRETPKDEGWGRGRRPVVNVSWRDCVKYCEWLSKETAKLYRLPSEAKWEYACRAGTTTRYAFGDVITERDANYGSIVDSPSDGDILESTSVVGSYRANIWGLYDMHGNVFEWVEDVWHDSYEGAPTDGSAWTEGQGIESSLGRVQRGGSWGVPVENLLRSAFRCETLPNDGYRNLGFRVARTLD